MSATKASSIHGNAGLDIDFKHPLRDHEGEGNPLNERVNASAYTLVSTEIVTVRESIPETTITRNLIPWRIHETD